MIFCFTTVPKDMDVKLKGTMIGALFLIVSIINIYKKDIINHSQTTSNLNHKFPKLAFMETCFNSSLYLVIAITQNIHNFYEF